MPAAAAAAGERPEQVGQFRHAGRGVRRLVARVECRQLDRDRVAVRHVRRADPADRRDIAVVITLGVVRRPRRLPKHVEAGGEAGIVLVGGAFERLVDRPPHNEDLAHHPHRRADRGPHERLARPRDQPPQHRGAARLADDGAGQHQPPCRRVDQRRIRLAGMRAPVGAADLVTDQQVGGGGVGHAQERLGQAEQRDALGCIQPVLLEEAVDPPRPLRRAQVGEQAERPVLDPRPRRRVERRARKQPGKHVGLGGAVEVAHCGTGGGHFGGVRHAAASSVTDPPGHPATNTALKARSSQASIAASSGTRPPIRKRE